MKNSLPSVQTLDLKIRWNTRLVTLAMLLLSTASLYAQSRGLEVEIQKQHQRGAPALVWLFPPYEEGDWEYKTLSGTEWQTDPRFSVPYQVGVMTACFMARQRCCDEEVYSGCVGLEVCDNQPTQLVTVKHNPCGLQQVTVTLNEALPEGEYLKVIAGGELHELPYTGNAFNLKLEHYTYNDYCNLIVPLDVSQMAPYFQGYPKITNMCGRQYKGAIDLVDVREQLDASWVIAWEHDTTLHDWQAEVGPGNFCYTLSSPLFPDCVVRNCVEVKRFEVTPTRIQHPETQGGQGTVELTNQSSPVLAASIQIGSHSFTNVTTSVLVSLPAGTYAYTYTFANGCASGGTVKIVHGCGGVMQQEYLQINGTRASAALANDGLIGISLYSPINPVLNISISSELYQESRIAVNGPNSFGPLPGAVYEVTVWSSCGFRRTELLDLRQCSGFGEFLGRFRDFSQDCGTGNSGSYTVNLPAYYAPYTTKLNGVPTQLPFTGLSPGSYLATIIDRTGCETDLPFQMEAGTAWPTTKKVVQYIAATDRCVYRNYCGSTPLDTFHHRPLITNRSSKGDNCTISYGCEAGHVVRIRNDSSNGWEWDPNISAQYGVDVCTRFKFCPITGEVLKSQGGSIVYRRKFAVGCCAQYCRFGLGNLYPTGHCHVKDPNDPDKKGPCDAATPPPIKTHGPIALVGSLCQGAISNPMYGHPSQVLTVTDSVEGQTHFINFVQPVDTSIEIVETWTEKPAYYWHQIINGDTVEILREQNSGRLGTIRVATRAGKERFAEFDGENLLEVVVYPNQRTIGLITEASFIGYHSPSASLLPAIIAWQIDFMVDSIQPKAIYDWPNGLNHNLHFAGFYQDSLPTFVSQQRYGESTVLAFYSSGAVDSVATSCNLRYLGISTDARTSYFGNSTTTYAFSPELSSTESSCLLRRKTYTHFGYEVSEGPGAFRVVPAGLPEDAVVYNQINQRRKELLRCNTQKLVLQDVRPTHTLSISPNPANEFILVQVDGILPSTSSIQIVNALGQAVLSRPAAGSLSIDLQQLAPGFYQVQLFDQSSGTALARSSLVIER